MDLLLLMSTKGHSMYATLAEKTWNKKKYDIVFLCLKPVTILTLGWFCAKIRASDMRTTAMKLAGLITGLVLITTALYAQASPGEATSDPVTTTITLPKDALCYTGPKGASIIYGAIELLRGGGQRNHLYISKDGKTYFEVVESKVERSGQLTITTFSEAGKRQFKDNFWKWDGMSIKFDNQLYKQTSAPKSISAVVLPSTRVALYLYRTADKELLAVTTDKLNDIWGNWKVFLGSNARYKMLSILDLDPNGPIRTPQGEFNFVKGTWKGMALTPLDPNKYVLTEVTINGTTTLVINEK